MMTMYAVPKGFKWPEEIQDWPEEKKYLRELHKAGLVLVVDDLSFNYFGTRKPEKVWTSQKEHTRGLRYSGKIFEGNEIMEFSSALSEIIDGLLDSGLKIVEIDCHIGDGPIPITWNKLDSRKILPVPNIAIATHLMNMRSYLNWAHEYGFSILFSGD